MDKIIFDKVGQRLKTARESAGITLENAGKKVGVYKSTVLRWENGETNKIKIPILDALAELYDVNPIWLMGYDVPVKRPFKNLNIDGLEEDDIKKVQEYIDFLKSKKIK